MKEVVRKGMETAAKRGLKQRAVACPLAPVVATGMKSNMGMRAGAGLGAVIAAQKIKKAYITGALIGAGVTALGYYLYKKNQQKVDDFLCEQKIEVKSPISPNYEDMDLETLNETKTRLEEIIAIKEVNG